MIYSSVYIDFCQTKNTEQIKFMDESGFKRTDENLTSVTLGEGTVC